MGRASGGGPRTTVVAIAPLLQEARGSSGVRPAGSNGMGLRRLTTATTAPLLQQEAGGSSRVQPAGSSGGGPRTTVAAAVAALMQCAGFGGVARFTAAITIPPFRIVLAGVAVGVAAASSQRGQ